jgi:hypothetical protein
MEKGKWVRSEYKEIILYLFLGVFVTIMIPLFVGFTLLAFEESLVAGQPLVFGAYLTNYLLYLAFIIASLFLIIYPLGRLFSIRKGEHPATQRPVSWFRIFTASFIFAPEENGFLYWLSDKLKLKKNFMKWTLNPIRVIIFSIIIFGLFGVLQTIYPQLTISGVPQIQLQQITVASEIVFSAEPASFGENGVLLFMFCLLMGINAWFCAKFKLGKGAWFAIGFLIICPLMGLQWAGYHLLVYGNSEAGMLATFIFGYLGSTLTLLFGIFLLWWIWHQANNIFWKLGQMAMLKEDILLITMIALVLLIIAWVSTEVLIHKFRKKKEGVPTSIPEN